MPRARALFLAAAFAISACVPAVEAPLVGAPPAALGVDPFYTKHVSAGGLPIVSSGRVSDDALLAARAMAIGMLVHRPDLADWLIANGYRIAIIAEDEALLDLPENADWEKPARDDPRLTRCERKHYDTRIGRLSDREYWDRRARAIGGKHMVASVEDVLALPSTRYPGETIFVHEFAHQILDAIKSADSTLYRQVEAAYAAARKTGMWKDEYAMTTVQEYWAEGTQLWFNSDALTVIEGRRILDHPDLASYDPRLYAVLAQVYGENHRLAGDPNWMSPLRVPPGPIPENTAEFC